MHFLGRGFEPSHLHTQIIAPEGAFIILCVEMRKQKVLLSWGFDQAQAYREAMPSWGRECLVFCELKAIENG